jgi:NTP pyrophosphatase (non-canonical NTP hydrolase)
MSDIEYIASRLSREDILCQLAEEASELAQAALKLRRVITGTNPTPMNYRDACDNLIEEIADVRAAERVVICAGTEDTSTANLAIESKMEYKTYRWAKRLREKEDGDDKDHCTASLDIEDKKDCTIYRWAKRLREKEDGDDKD